LAAVEQQPSTADEEKPPEGEKAVRSYTNPHVSLIQQLLKAYHEQKEEIKRLKTQLATAEIKIRQLTNSS
jgi:hypothetical protein